MRVQVHAADHGGCGHYRLRWPAQALADDHADVTFGDTIRGVFQADELIAVDPPDTDVIVYQRPLAQTVVDTIPFLQSHGIAVVVEIDDDFHALPHHNPAYRQTDPTRDPAYNRDHLMRACQLADLVTCTTPALARRYAPHGRSVVIGNYVRARWLELEPVRPDGPPRVGWTGTVATHQGDLGTVGMAVRDTLIVHGWKFRAIGSAETHPRLGLPRQPGEVEPWADLTTDAYPEAIGRLTLGIVPLTRSPFNRAKSCLKGIEYAALGVPFVASDVADYRRLAKAGVGRLARNERDWYRELDQLMGDETYRATLAGQGRERLAGWTIEGNAWRWWEAWERAHKRRKNK